MDGNSGQLPTFSENADATAEFLPRPSAKALGKRKVIVDDNDGENSLSDAN